MLIALEQVSGLIDEKIDYVVNSLFFDTYKNIVIAKNKLDAIEDRGIDISHISKISEEKKVIFELEERFDLGLFKEKLQDFIMSDGIGNLSVSNIIFSSLDHELIQWLKKAHESISTEISMNAVHVDGEVIASRVGVDFVRLEYHRMHDDSVRTMQGTGLKIRVITRSTTWFQEYEHFGWSRTADLDRRIKEGLIDIYTTSDWEFTKNLLRSHIGGV